MIQTLAVTKIRYGEHVLENLGRLRPGCGGQGKIHGQFLQYHLPFKPCEKVVNPRNGDGPRTICRTLEGKIHGGLFRLCKRERWMKLVLVSCKRQLH